MHKTTWKLKSPQITYGNDGVFASVLLAGDETFELKIRISKKILNFQWSPEALLTWVLLPAMKAGVDIEFDSAISTQYHFGIKEIQQIFHSWDKSYQKIEICNSGARREIKKTNRKATFFTGGVDSFFTVLEHLEEIDALIYVHGFDVPLENTDLRKIVTEGVRGAAKELGKELIEIETNLRVYGQKNIPWDMYHGPALAGIGLLFDGIFDQIFIPASHSYSELFPWGSHPLLDPLWSTESLSFVHADIHANRAQKTVAIATNNTALKYLRVCWKNSGGKYNCGNCEKCIRTMVALKSVGALERCATLPHTINTARLRRVLVDQNSASFLKENLELLRRKNSAPELQDAIQDALDGLYQKGFRGYAKRAIKFARRKLFKREKV